MSSYDRKTPREIGLAVKYYFKENGISNDAAAHELGSAVQTVANQLSGKKFGIDIAERYAKAFGFNEIFLITGKGNLLADNNDLRAKELENEKLKEEIQELKIEINNLQSTVASQQDTLRTTILMLAKKN